MTYVYENPLEHGYKRFKLSRKEHNNLFPVNKISIFKSLKFKYEYYYSDSFIKIQTLISLPYIILATILAPIAFIFYGIVNFKELVNEYKRVYNQKKYGSFISNNIWSTTDAFKAIKQLKNL